MDSITVNILQSIPLYVEIVLQIIERQYNFTVIDESKKD